MNADAETSPGWLPLGRDDASRVAAGLCSLLAIGLLALAAQVTVPMIPVPMTLQTLAVLLIAIAFTPWLSAALVMSYLALALAGLPVLADGGAGLARLTGPTAGYLVGFVIAAWWLARGLHGATAARSTGWALARFLGAHAIILGLGAAWLSVRIGPARAVEAGVLPFLPGAVAKSAAAWGVFLLLRHPTLSGFSAPRLDEGGR